MLPIKKTCILTVIWDELGFFTGSRSVFLFSVVLSDDVCRCSKVESITTIEIYIGHDFLFINEVYQVMERKRPPENTTIIWFTINFPAQKRKILKFSKIIRGGCAILYYATVNFCKVLIWVAASAAHGSVTLHRSCRLTFTSHSNSSKKKNQKSKLSKKQQILHHQTIEFKQLRYIATSYT